MIRCPKCGTVNPDGSRFCSNCGFKLPQTRIRCPVCGAYNPVSNIYCEKCHARLNPEAESAEETGVEDLISLPTRTNGDVPDWLRGLLAEEELSPEAIEEEPPVAPAEGLPDWLADLAPEEPAAEEEAPAAPVGEGVPDWLADLAPEEPAAEEEAPAAPAGEGVPDWLADLAPEEPAAEEEEAPAAAPLEAAAPEEPAVELGVEEEEEEEDEEDLITPLPSTRAPDEEIPDWLKNLGERTEDATATTEALSQGAVPEWLRRIKPPGTGPLPPLEDVLGEVAEAEGGPARAEIPDWVRKLRPSEEQAASTPPPFAPSAMVDTGPLQGLSGIIPPAPALDAPPSYAPETPPEIPQTLREAAQLWQTILERPRGRRRPVARRRRRRSPWGDALIRLATSLLLIGVILAAIFDLVPGDLVGEARPAPQIGIAPSVEMIGNLQPDDLVIVAFEYGAAQKEEMDELSSALFAHLMERQVQIVAVSTSAQGAGIAESTLEQARRRYPDFADKVSNFGYLPGDATSTARFLATPQVQEAKLLIVFAADADHLRWWVEQNSTTAHPLPLIAAINGATAPLVRPYLESDKVQGWASGLIGAAGYWQARGLPLDEGLARRLTALRVAQWATAALILIGSAYYLFAGRKEAE